MPLVFDKQINSDSRLLVWKVLEIPEMVIKELDVPSKEIEKFESIKHPSRKKEFVGKLQIYQKLGIPVPETLENGKPILPEGHISLSHCGDFVTAIISDKAVGIDIQDRTPRLLRIKHKFCNQPELDFAARSGNELEVLTRIWCSKEAVFKIFGENILFAEQMKVRLDLNAPKNISCELDREGIHQIELETCEFEGYLLVYTL